MKSSPPLSGTGSIKTPITTSTPEVEEFHDARENPVSLISAGADKSTLSTPEETLLSQRKVTQIEPDRSIYRSVSVRSEPVAGREEDDVFEDALDENPILIQALQTQQAVREKQAADPITVVANQPTHNILMIQFKEDPHGTRDLVKMRLDALDKDIEQTFSRFGNKGAARQLHTQLLNWLAALDQRMANDTDNTAKAEDAFAQLLNALREYEATFHKDSWLDKATIAFIGVERLLNSPLDDELKAVIPEAQLIKGDIHLLNPDVITMDNVGRVLYNDNALSDLIAKIVNSYTRHTLDQRYKNQIKALNISNFPGHKQASDPHQLTSHLVQNCGEAVHQILESAFLYKSKQTNSKDQQEGRELLTRLAQCKGDSAATLELITETPGLLDYISQEFQGRYIDAATANLQKEVDITLQNDGNAKPEQITKLRHSFQELQKLARTLGRTEDKLEELSQGIDRIAYTPLYRIITSRTYKGEQVWFLEQNISLDEVIQAGKKITNDAMAKEIRALKVFIEHPEGDDVQAIRKHLVAKDTLLSHQQEYIIAQAQANLGKNEAFQDALITARKIERRRPPYQLIAEDSTPQQRAIRAGRAVLTPNSQPLEQRLQTLTLEHELALDGYDFNEEIYNLFASLPGIYQNTEDARAEGRREAQRLMASYRIGNLSMAGLITGMLGAGFEVRNAFIQQFREILTGAAALGQIDPATLRAISGKFNQTLSILANSASATPKLFALFHETHARIAGEAQAQYFIEAVGDNNAKLHLEQLTDAERTAVRRLMAINSLLTASIYTPTCVEGAINVALGGANPLNMAWTTASTAAKVFTTYLIGNKVNTMSGTDVKIANSTLDILTDGPTMAASRQSMMARSADMLAGLATGRSLTDVTVSSGILYPFKVLFKGVVDAFKDVINRKPGAWTKAGAMLLRIAPIITIPIVTVATIVAFPPVGITAIVILTLLTLFTTATTAWSWANYIVGTMGLVDIAALAYERAEEIIFGNEAIDFKAMADQLLIEGGEKERCERLARNHAYAALSRQYWERFAEENQARAEAIDTQIRADIDRIDNKRLLEIANTLRYLENLELHKVSLQELQEKLPEEEAKNLPKAGQEHHLRAWALGLRERLHYELYACTGSDTIPESDDELIEQVQQFNIERLRGLNLEGFYLPHLPAPLEGEETEMERTIRLTAGQIYLKTQHRLEVLLARLMTSGLQSVYISRAKASGKYKRDRQTEAVMMRPDTFAKVLQDDAALQEAIRREFIDVVRSEIQRSNVSGQVLLKQKLHDNGVDLKDEDIDALLSSS